jgi:hypothetical protein
MGYDDEMGPTWKDVEIEKQKQSENYTNGSAAGKLGKKISERPNNLNDEQIKDWEAGWYAAQPKDPELEHK